MEALVGGITFVDSENGRQYRVKLIPENTLTDDPSGRFPVGPIGWRDGRLPFTFSDVEGEPHEEARHVGNLFNIRREVIDGVTWVVADLDWDNDELALEAKRLVDEDRITGVSIHATDLDAYLICGVPDQPTNETVLAAAEAFNPDECPMDNWVEAWLNVVLGSATLLMLPAFEEAEVVVAGGRGEATDDSEWDAGEAMRKAGSADDPAAAFRAIAIETTTGEPSERQHWALPHHKTPGGPANAAAIRNARSRFEQTKNLKDKDAARAHLFEVHKLPSEVEAAIKVSNVVSISAEQALQDVNRFVTAFSSEIESDGKAWVAAIDLMRPPADWFTTPEAHEPSAVIVTDEGQVFGHLTEKDCHRGFFDSCVLPPDDAANFEEFHNNGTVYLDNGETLRVGNLTIDLNHADVRASADRAKAHYDNSGAVVAQVRASQGQHGIWLAGAIAPWATAEQVEKLKRLRLSGDWRPTRDGRHYLIAAQAVAVPGFPIRARVASGEIEEYTTLGPENVEALTDDEKALIEGASDIALVASALIQTNAMLAELLQWKRDQEYREIKSEFDTV